MNTLVVYDSQYGNTEHIAQAIADALSTFGQTRLTRVDPAHPADVQGVDLLIVGCPTQGWNSTPAIQSFLKEVTSDKFRNMAVACFDTRFRKARWMTGSAASTMAKKLQERGISLLVPPESFFVEATEGPLQPEELERAAAWAQALAKAVETAHPVIHEA